MHPLYVYIPRSELCITKIGVHFRLTVFIIWLCPYQIYIYLMPRAVDAFTMADILYTYALIIMDSAIYFAVYKINILLYNIIR